MMGLEVLEPFGIWPENQDALDVFLSCHFDRQLGMAQLLWLGIPTREIRATCDMLEKPRPWTPILHGVRVMAMVARQELNEMESQRAEEARQNSRSR